VVSVEYVVRERECVQVQCALHRLPSCYCDCAISVCNIDIILID